MLRTIIRTASLFLLCALSSLTAAGQTTVVNPKVVEFDPSADHAALTAEGHALVTRYDLQIFLPGATQPISTASLGKPAADADGKIRVDFSTVLVGWPPANGTYEARVAAVGPTGSGQSDPSNPFDFQAVVTPPPCTFTLSVAAVSVAATGSTSTVSVTASVGTCGWTAASNASWATVTPASGTGTGTVSVTVAANTGDARTATVTIGGLTYTVTQAAVPPSCTFTLSATAVSVAATGSTSTVSVTASAGTCAWTASTMASWLPLATASGVGSASVGYSVLRNSTGQTRTATVSVGGKVLTVTQASVARPAPPKGLKLSSVIAVK